MGDLLAGKTVLISGAAHGQGRAHALVSAREGANVIGFDINRQLRHVPYSMGTEGELAETARLVEKLGQRMLAITADARSLEQMERVVEQGISEFGAIDAVVSNHAIVSWSSFWEMSEEMWDDVIETNLSAVWKIVRAVTPHLIERGSGSIVITSSINGEQPGGSFAHYSSSKAGAIGLMKAVARELAPHNIRCNAILPGLTDTPMNDSQWLYDLIVGHKDATREEMVEAGRYAVALKGRTWQDPVEVANAGLFFNSDLAANVTGQTLAVDAGTSLLGPYNPAPVRD